MNIYVQIYDNQGAFNLFEIKEPIRVTPYLANLTYIMDNLILANAYFSTNIIMHEGNYLKSLQELQSIASLLNEQSLRDKYGLVLKNNSFFNYFPNIYGPLTYFTGVSAVIFFLN